MGILMVRNCLVLARKMRRNQAGGAIVEAAFALPALALLILGLAQVVTVLFAQSTVHHALSEGARFALVSGQDSHSAIEQRIRNALSTLDNEGIKELTISEAMQSASVRKVTLSVRYEVKLFMPFLPSDLLTLQDRKVVYV